MGGLDPLAALGADAVAQAQAAFQEAAINLGVAADILQAQISVGDLITATVLPPENGNDRLLILGQTVVAQIPPGINPGENILLQVTGFAGNQILVRNLGLVDPENPPVTASIELPVTPEGVPTTAVLTTQLAPAPNQSPAQQPGNALPTTQNSGSTTPALNKPVAPPREIFVAASVRPGTASPPLESLRALALEPPEPGEVEARIALNRAAQNDGGVRDRLAPPNAPRGAVAPGAPQPVGGRIPIPPPSVLSRTAAQPLHASLTPAAQRAAIASRAVPLQTPAQNALHALAQSSPREVSLLARLRVPLSTGTLAAARLISEAAETVPKAYAKLDELLARLPSSDPRSAVLRSLLAFAGKIDLRNVRALPEQIASFVSNVVDGAESKIASIIRMLAEALPSDDLGNAPGQSPASAANARAALSNSGPSVPLPLGVPADTPVAVQARIAERMVALEFDAKAVLQSLVQTGSQNTTAQVTQAASEALAATTAVQLNVLAAQQADPNTIAIPLPAFFYEGGRATQLRISRDASGGQRNRLDKDNFHISFVLDTQTMGTVAIDLQTVGRAVSINVKTERTSSADRFRDTLADLRVRLENLKYRIAAIAADVAPVGGAQPALVPQTEPLDKPSSNVDMRA